MSRHYWWQLWKRLLLWIYVTSVVGLYAYAWWHAPFSKKDRAQIKKLANQPFVSSDDCTAHPTVSVIIPARNEEQNIHRCVTSLLAQVDVHYEIIVVDDGSTDNTSHILNTIERFHPSKDLLRILHVQELPKGWAGKPHALHMGVQKARGEWFLFTDADTWHSPTALRTVLTLAKDGHIDLLTLGTKQELITFWERVMMPMAYLALSIRFPIKSLNNPNSTMASANGQYILIRRSTYESVGGFKRPDLRSAILDDVELGRVVKGNGFHLHFMDGGDLVHVRMYRGLYEAWQGWLKSAFLTNRGGLLTALRELLALLAFNVFPFIFLFLAIIPKKRYCTNCKSNEMYIATSIEMTALLAYRIWMNKMLDIPWYYIFTHMLAALLFAGILVQATWNALIGRGLKWRNRLYAFNPK